MSVRLNILILMIVTFTLPAFDTYPDAFFAGRKAEQQKRFADAADCYRKAEALAGSPHEKYNALLRRAEALRQDKKWDEARGTLQEISQINGISPYQRGSALAQIGHYFFWEGKLDEAAESFANISEDRNVHPDNRIGALIDRGNILTRQEKYGEAAAEYRKVIAVPGILPYFQATAYLRLASVYKTSGEYAEACRALDSAEKIPDLPPASLSAVIMQRGELYYAEKKYREAIDEFNRIFILDAPSRYHLDAVDWHLGNVYFYGLKDMDQAKFHYLRARKSPVNWISKNAREKLESILK